MGRHFNSTVAMILALSAMVTSQGWAYPTPVDFDGTLLRWRIGSGDAPITYAIDAGESDVVVYGDLVDSSAEKWSEIDSSYLRLERAADDQKAQITIKLRNSIEGSDYSSGFASFDESGKHGPIHCTTEILVGGSLGQTAVAKTILHELGHCIGLGHSVIPEAIMSYTLEKNVFNLDTDDEAAASRLYPVDGPVRLPKGCAIGALVAVDARGVTLMMWLLLPIVSLISGPKLLWRLGPRRGTKAARQ